MKDRRDILVTTTTRRKSPWSNIPRQSNKIQRLRSRRSGIDCCKSLKESLTSTCLASRRHTTWLNQVLVQDHLPVSLRCLATVRWTASLNNQDAAKVFRSARISNFAQRNPWEHIPQCRPSICNTLSTMDTACLRCLLQSSMSTMVHH